MDTRSHRWKLRLSAIVVVVVAAWLLLWPVMSLIRSLVALALYVVVALVAYNVGRFVGRSTRDD